MKTISNKLRITISLLTMFTLATLTSSYSMAVTTPPVEPSKKASETACSRIAALSLADTPEIKKRITTMQANFAARLTAVTAKQDSVNQKVIAARVEATTKFDATIATLQQKVGLTSTQRTTIETYQKDIRAAQTTRRAAVDAARATYRGALTDAITAHQTKLSTAVTTYQTSVNTAFTTATANCGNPAAITTLKASVKTARETLAADSKKNDTAAAAIKKLAETRRAAVKAADDAFTKKIAELTTILKSAMKL